VKKQNGMNNPGDRVLVLSGMATNYKNLVTGLISYAHKYLYAVDHDIGISYDNNDIVITIRIRNVADKIARFD